MATRRLRSVLIGLAAVALMSAVPSQAEGNYWAGVAEETIAALTTLREAHRAGDVDSAKKAAITAYFGVFETRKLEAALRKEMGQKHTVAVESQFNQLRKMVGQGASAEEVAKRVTQLSDVLREDAKLLDDKGIPENVFIVN
ncbi:MAG TPA: hypothetical protein VEB64_06005 [Azospirillaceae bacterium]|nr:hypothetical protein [Azospirillaceae bacterium]